MAFIAFGFTGLLLLLIVGGVVIFLLASRRSGSGSPPPPEVAPGMTLNCPTCGQETDAARSACRHCDAEL